MRTFAPRQILQKPVSSSVTRPKMATLGLVQREHDGLTGTVPPRFGYDFSRIPTHPSAAGAIQTKLAVNDPGDEYEQEADSISEQVMRMPEPHLQRACACGGKCPKCLTSQPGHGTEFLHTKRVGSGDWGQTAVPPIVHEVLRSPGQPIDLTTRAFMDPRFGHNFEQVRVHTDKKAGDSAHAINALAYTFGRHLVFGAGQYSPTTVSGRRLLAHELAHFVQQGFAGSSLPQRVGDPGDALESQADTVDGVIKNVSRPSADHAISMPPTVQATLLQRKEALIPKFALPPAKEAVYMKPSATARKAVSQHCGKASTWTCGEEGMGTTCEGCGIELDSWPDQDPCRKEEPKGKPRTCSCKSVLDKVGTKVAAYKPKRCGEKLKVKDRDSGTEKIVTVVDAGPYADDKDRIIDLHEDVFGKGAHVFNVCVSPSSGVDNRLHNCWDGFGGVPPAKPKKEKESKK